MSWQAQTAVNHHSKQTNLGLFRLLMYLAEGADENGCIDPAPSQETLAEFFDVSDRTIRNWINNLIDSKELARTRRGRGEGNPSAYRIDLPMPENGTELIGKYEERNPINVSGNLEERLKSLEEKMAAFLPVIERLQEIEEGLTGITGKVNRKGHSLKNADDPIMIQEDNNINAFFEAFKSATTFTAPHESTDAYMDHWREPALEMIRAAGDTEIAIGIMVEAVKLLFQKNYSFTSPKSIQVTFANILGQRRAAVSQNGSRPTDLWESEVMEWAHGRKSFDDLGAAVKDAIRKSGGDGIAKMNEFQLRDAKEKFNRAIT